MNKENYTKKEVCQNNIVRYYDSKGRRHRLDGPAIEYSGKKGWWYVNGRRHRLDGPALVWYDCACWAINGVDYKKTQHNALVLFSVLEPQRIEINPTKE
jgi:hypothetical protein